MKILVAGGAGFIGSHLAERLLNEGHEITIVDSLITGSRKNIGAFERKIEFIEQDISEMNGKPGGKRFERIYCLASPASPVDYQNKPLETMLANSLGVKNMLDLAKKTRSEE